MLRGRTVNPFSVCEPVQPLSDMADS